MTELNTKPKWADGRTVEQLYPGLGGKTRRYDLLNRGLICAKKHGKSTLFDLDSIDQFIASLPDYGKVA